MSQYLLDTNILLYAFADTKRLKSKTRKILENISNEIFVSVVSVWEISIKYDIGKLPLQSTWAIDLETYMREEEFTLLSVKPHHCYGITNLPMHHKDQFDRLIISQAISENVTLITTDEKFQKYKVKLHLM